ncbi:hypothetical protein C8R47DRAFT_1165134 [Mycena vitilis]|nr:hypothetical protein C8R47DRAFT_1165134 [Mycena vitilis]
MPIPASAIVDFATPNLKRNIPGIQDEVRARLEWNWGLGHHHLDEHLQGIGMYFLALGLWLLLTNNSVDPAGILMDETLLVFPPNDIITDIWHRYGVAKLGVRRPHIQQLYDGRKSFEYMVVPINPLSALPARLVSLGVPPHLALCTTSGKMTKAWGALPAETATALRLSLIERSQAVYHDRPALEMWDFDIMKLTHRTWSSSDYVPKSFHSESSDHTMVEESPVSERKLLSNHKPDSEAGSSASRCEPKRRLLPSERLEDLRIAPIRLFPSVDEEDEDDTIDTDSHISGVDDPDDFAKASAARGDYKVPRKLLKEIKRWARGTSGADPGDAVLNDAQVGQDLTEQPRMAASLDLDQADWQLRHSRFANARTMD